MIIRFLIAFWILLQVSVAGPSQQILLSQKTASSSSIAVQNSWLLKGSAGTYSVTVSGINTGDLLVVSFAEWNTSAANATISDNLSSAGWTKVTTAVVSTSTAFQLTVWYLANASSGITSVNITRSTGGSNFGSVIVHRISGCSTSSPFTSGEFTTATGTSSTPSVGPVTNGTANSIHMAFLTDETGANPCTMTINSSGTTGTWSLFNTSTSQNLDGNYMSQSVPNQIVTTSAARSHAWVIESSMRWAAITAAFH